MPSASLVVRVSAQIAEFQKSFDDASKTASKFADNFEGIATRAAAVGTFIGNIATDIAKSMARALGQAISDAVRLSSEFNNAFIGLSSVARAFGTDADLAKAAAQRLSSDGLLPLKDSATGLKNLLAAGFNLDQAVKLMDAFKDSAAFGRQSALSFGDAIRSATEGVKNGNSILVDNAGVTKNLSQILKEAGFSAQDLSRASSDAGVRMALFNGILKETLAQTGDAARLMETYSGQVTRLNTVYQNLLGNLGDAITQNATVAKALQVVSGFVLQLSQHLSNNRNAFNYVSDAIIVFVRALSSTVEFVDIAQRKFNSFVISLNSVLTTIVTGAQNLFMVVEKIERIQQVLDPARFQQHGMAAREAATAYRFLGGIIDTLGQSTQTAKTDQENWSKTLQGLKGTLDGVTKELEATRGKTVELGVSAIGAGAAINNGITEPSKKAQAELAKLKKLLAETTPGLQEGIRSMPGVNVGLPDLAGVMIPDFVRNFRTGLQEGIRTMPGINIGKPDLEAVLQVKTFREIFSDLGRELPDLIFGALRDGGSVVVPIAGLLADKFTKAFAERVQKAADTGTQLSGGSKALGVAGLGLSSLIGGMGFGEEFGKAKGALAGAATGAVAGIPLAAVTGGLSIAVGAIAGAIGGLIGGAKKAKEQLQELRQAQADVIREFGGLAALKSKADEFGISIGNALTTKNPEEFTRVMELLGKKIDEQKTRIEGFGIAVEGINTKAALFAAPFLALIQGSQEADANLSIFNAKLAEMGQRGQAEFERLGTFAAAAFAGMVRESGDAAGAIQALSPTLGVLQQGLEKFGLTSTGTIDSLLGMFKFINDAVTGPIFASIQATGQIFIGLQQGGLITKDLFQTVATDIGASFRDLEAKGGDVALAMALSQPVLQKLWEGQQLYGQVTDATTQALLKQAVEQGLVGAHMKDVNQKILDVLIAIADVFGADIPAAMRTTEQAAVATATAVGQAFSNIKVSPITVPIDWDVSDYVPPPRSYRGVELASGGIVRRPTLALVGEAGPEAVIPLNQLGRMSPQSGESTVIFEIDGRQIAAATVPHLPGAIRRYVPA